MSLVLRRVGRYEVLRELGRGGMATVHLARQIDLDRPVALKELALEQVMNPESAERFLRESRIAGGLNHPNVVAVHEYFEHHGTHFISMEYLDRGSLRDYRGRLTLAEIAGTLEGILAGLTHAHARGIVHRDLKPENVMVTSEGTVKIADFGIARALDQAVTGQYLTATGTAMGTPAYMAPEQALGEEVTAATDLYSVGVMAYEQMCGQLPFHDSTTPIAILVRHVNEPIPPPGTINPDLDPGLAAWIEWLLMKDPASRPASAFEAWERLEEVVIKLLGHHWRRQARLLGAEPTAAKRDPLTRATFEQSLVAMPQADPPPATSEEVAGEQTGYRTVEPRDAVTPPVVEPPAQGTSESEPADTGPDPGRDGVIAQPPQSGAMRFPTEGVPSPTVSEGVPAGQSVEDHRAESPAVTPNAEPERSAVPILQPTSTSRKSAAVTLPPARTTPHRSFVLTDVFARARRGRTRNRTWWAMLGIAVVVGAAAAALVMLLGRSTSNEAKPTPPTLPRLVKDITPRPSERIGLSDSGTSLALSAPGGGVVVLDDTTRAIRATGSDPAKPHAIAIAGDKVSIADDVAITTFRLPTMTPLQALPFAHGSAIAASQDGKRIAAVRAVGRNNGELCLLTGEALRPCVALGFVPSGLRITSAGPILVADGSGGTLAQYAPRGGMLVLERRIQVGPDPHGAMDSVGGRLYVPVRRGVAIVDLQTGRSRKVALPSTPTAVAFVPSTGRLFAALYSQRGIAVVNPSVRGPAPSVVRVGARLVGIVSGSTTSNASVLFAYGGDDETLYRLDSRTGKPIGSTTLKTLAAHSVRIVARTPRLMRHGNTVTVRIPLTGARLARAALLVPNGRISDGRAAVEAWQGGIRSSARGRETLSGLTVAVLPGLGHVTVAISAKAGAFDTIRASLGADGDGIVIRAKKHLAPRPPVTPSQSVAPSQPVTPSQVTPSRPVTPSQSTHRPTAPGQPHFG
jgi:serine/threonine protein kinase/DNA-binding beta-propeller fold protein YncE